MLMVYCILVIDISALNEASYWFEKCLLLLAVLQHIKNGTFLQLIQSQPTLCLLFLFNQLSLITNGSFSRNSTCNNLSALWTCVINWQDYYIVEVGVQFMSIPPNIWYINRACQQHSHNAIFTGFSGNTQSKSYNAIIDWVCSGFLKWCIIGYSLTCLIVWHM